MTPVEIHCCIADIARAAIEIQKIMNSDKLSYNKRIEDLTENIFKYTYLLHEEFFPGCIEEESKENQEND